MKTSGICNAQSARKHRKMGHDVARRPDGRYSWVNINGARGVIKGMVDIFSNLVEVRRQEDLPARVPVSWPRKVAIVVTVSGLTIRKGNQFWPKRRNQHSKPFEVLSLMSGTHDVMFRRVGSDKVSIATIEEFEAMIGKRVEE